MHEITLIKNKFVIIQHYISTKKGGEICENLESKLKTFVQYRISISSRNMSVE